MGTDNTEVINPLYLTDFESIRRLKWADLTGVILWPLRKPMLGKS